MSTVADIPDDLRGLLPHELEPQGTFAMNDFRLRVEDTPAAFRVLPPGPQGVALGVMVAVILSVFAGFWVVLERVRPESMPWPLGVPVVLVGVVAVGGALGGHLLRLRYLRGRGPLLEFDKRARRVRIDGGRHEFAAGEVVCVQSLTNWSGTHNRSLHSELNLITVAGGRRERHHLIATMDSRRTSFDFVVRPLRAATGLRVLRVSRSGLLGSGPLVVEEVEATRSR
jgi:hypothetical protein